MYVTLLISYRVEFYVYSYLIFVYLFNYEYIPVIYFISTSTIKYLSTVRQEFTIKHSFLNKVLHLTKM